MSLQKATVWARESFTEDSRPTMATVKRWIKDGHIAGQIINKGYYVDTDAENKRAATAKQSSRSPLIAGKFTIKK